MMLAAAFRDSMTSKVTLGVLAGSALLWLGLLLAGLATGEALGYLAFATLIASAGVMLATAISLKASERAHKLARIVWVIVSFAVLILAVVVGDAAAGATLVVYSMGALSFPVGTVAIPVIGTFASKVSDSWLGMLLIWAACASIGYAQWFLVLPRLIGRAEPRRP